MNYEQKNKLMQKYICLICEVDEEKLRTLFKEVFYFSKHDRISKELMIDFLTETDDKLSFSIIKFVSNILYENRKLVYELINDGIYNVTIIPFKVWKEYKYINSMSDVDDFNNMMEVYFMYRKNNEDVDFNDVTIGKIYNELLTYDKMAIDHYGTNYINKSITNLDTTSDRKYSFTLFKRFKRTHDDTIKIDIESIKRMIGLVSIISKYDKGEYPCYTIFFDDISYIKRNQFDKYLCSMFP
ncbi:hypothetical protein [Moosepox virus GoldyGopher14]|nr:hypothetical protein [Moosepox virus GoldyGopher14]